MSKLTSETTSQKAHLPVWMEPAIAKKFPHPASYGRAMKAAIIIFGATRNGKTTKPVKIAVLAKKHGISYDRLRAALRDLEGAGFLVRYHQSGAQLQTASHYVMAMTPEEVGKLSPCECLQCLARAGRIPPGSHPARAASRPGKDSGGKALQNDDDGRRSDKETPKNKEQEQRVIETTRGHPGTTATHESAREPGLANTATRRFPYPHSHPHLPEFRGHPACTCVHVLGAEDRVDVWLAAQPQLLRAAGRSVRLPAPRHRGG